MLWRSKFQSCEAKYYHHSKLILIEKKTGAYFVFFFNYQLVLTDEMGFLKDNFNS